MATFDSRFQHAEWLIDEGKELDAFENRLPVVYKQDWHALIPFFDKSDTYHTNCQHILLTIVVTIGCAKEDDSVAGIMWAQRR